MESHAVALQGFRVSVRFVDGTTGEIDLALDAENDQEYLSAGLTMKSILLSAHSASLRDIGFLADFFERFLCPSEQAFKHFI